MYMDVTQISLQNAIEQYGNAPLDVLPPMHAGGRFYHLTERNSEVKDSTFANFDMKKPSAGSATNITEHVTVPTSEHVAEIVGRQGCKIKALRNKTNTYIKTPGRGEPPLFVITGQKSDVEMAVTEIRQASMHFTNIRAQRSKGISPPNIEGSITDRVQVPYRVVGLVVGPKGQTIKQIQAKTDTFIVTPSRERDPIFEITGRPEDVAKAREEIIGYICARTGMALEENNIGHYCFNSEDQENVEITLFHPLYKAGQLGTRDIEPSFNPFDRTPTGVWNPVKQEIEELPVQDSFPEFPFKLPPVPESYPENQSVKFHPENQNVKFHPENQNVKFHPENQSVKFHQRPARVFPEMQGTTGLISHDIKAPKTQGMKGPSIGKQGNLPKFSLPVNDMPFALENQENCDPIRSVPKRHISPRGQLDSRSPMRGLNVQTYNPFCWDNSSLLKTRSNSPASPPKLGATSGDILSVTDSGDEDFNLVRETLQDLQLGTAFSASDAAKISPLSNGSQHSSTESYSSLGATSSQQPVNDVMASFGGSLLGQWNPSPVQSIATSIASSNNNTLTASSDYTLGGTNIPDCWVLSPPKPAVSKTVLSVDNCAQVQNCYVCRISPINAALVPCGHNHFCYECASACIGGNCPSCAADTKNALRIFK